MVGFVSLHGNVRMFLVWISGAVMFTILLVWANTMAMSVRERVREVGVLKTLGFTPGTILGLILGEAVAISVAGGAVGYLISTVLLKGVQRSPMGGFLPALRVIDPVIAAVCILLAGLIGLVDSLVHLMGASRAPIVEALRSSNTYCYALFFVRLRIAPGDMMRRLASAVIVYGTVGEAGTNRYAAEQLQSRYRQSAQVDVPIYKDFEVSDDQLKHGDVIFIGRPETNSALAEWAGKIGLDYDGAVFKMNGQTYASERNSLVFAAKNPLDNAHMVLVFAGNDPLRLVEALNPQSAATPYAVLEDGKPLEGARAARRSNR